MTKLQVSFRVHCSLSHSEGSSAFGCSFLASIKYITEEIIKVSDNLFYRHSATVA